MDHQKDCCVELQKEIKDQKEIIDNLMITSELNRMRDILMAWLERTVYKGTYYSAEEEGLQTSAKNLITMISECYNSLNIPQGRALIAIEAAQDCIEKYKELYKKDIEQKKERKRQKFDSDSWTHYRIGDSAGSKMDGLV